MDHPNIAKVLDAGTTEAGRPYFVMELVRGIPITKFCDENRLNTEERLKLFIQVCHAIQHAHQKGVIHRDVKPSNILVTLHDDAPVPKVIDFGIAKATEQRLTDKTLFTQFEQFIGTPAYMSPEQASLTGLDIDTRSDIYALGVLLYELLTGCTPFDAKKLVQSGLDEMRRCIREDDPPRPSTRLGTFHQARLTTTAERRQVEPFKLIRLLRGDLDWIVMKCLEKDRRRRYETANALAQDIERHLTHHPVEASPPSVTYRTARFVKRNRGLVGSTALIAATLVVATFVSLRHAYRAERARHEADRQRQKASAFAQEALEKEKERRQSLTRLKVSEGFQRVQSGDLFNALAPFTEALVLEQDDPRREQLHKLRIESVVQRCPRLVQMWFPGGPVKHLELSPDGRRVLTVVQRLDAPPYRGAAQIWDWQNGRPLTAPMMHEAPLNFATFSPDGQQVVTVSDDKTARVWEAATGQPAPHSRPLLHSNHVVHAAFSPDGQLLITANPGRITDEPGGAIVWDLKTWEPVWEQRGQGYDLHFVCFAPDGRNALLGSRSMLATFVDIEKQARSSWVDRCWTLRCARYSPDGKALVVAGLISPGWEPFSGAQLFPAEIKPSTPLKAFSALMPHPTGAMTDARFSPDSRRVVTASTDQRARVWDARDGSPVSAPLPHNGAVLSAVFSPDNQHVASASRDGTVRIWDANTGSAVVPPLSHGGSVNSALFTPEGRQVVSACDDGAVRVWQPWTGSASRRTLAVRKKLGWARFTPDGRRVLTAADDGTAQLWDAATGQLLATNLAPAADFRRAESSPDGRRLVTLTYDYTLWLWDWTKPEAPPVILRFPRRPTMATFSPDGQKLLTASPGLEYSLRLLDAASGAPLTNWPFGNIVNVKAEPRAVKGALPTAASRPRYHPETPSYKDVAKAAFSPDGTHLATAHTHGVAVVWDLEHAKPLGPPIEHRGSVRDIRFSSDGRRVLTASDDNTACVWDARTGQPSIPSLSHEGSVVCAAFSPDDTRIVTASHDGTARIWDARSGRPVGSPLPHLDRVVDASFSPDGRWVVTASSDGTARVWDADSSEAITPPLVHDGPVSSAVFSPDGRQVLTASDDQTAALWALPRELRPTSNLVLLAQLLTGKPVATTNACTLQQCWTTLSTAYPADFSSAPSGLPEWQGQEVQRADRP